MELDFVTLGVFTTSPLQGNPLAIVFVPNARKSSLTEATKLAIATEFNLSEIVFLHEVGPSDEQAEYEIFSVKARIAFAGHPTIGTALYVMNMARARYPSVKSLRTIAGDVPIQYNLDTGIVEVLVPHDLHEHSKRLPHPLPGPATNPSGIDTVPALSIVKGMAFNLVPLSDLEALASVSQGLLPIPEVYSSPYLDTAEGWNNGLHGTFYYVETHPTIEGHLQEEPATRVIRTRSIGHREDPGTGSASSALCSYLALQEPSTRGAGPFLFHLIQGVEMNRRCDIHVRVWRSSDGTSVTSIALSGTAVKVMRGRLEF